LVIVRHRILPPIAELGPHDADLVRGIDADPHPAASDVGYGNRDAAVDNYLLAYFPTQNQHVQSSCSANGRYMGDLLDDSHLTV
jgi:hypothetical protein